MTSRRSRGGRLRRWLGTVALVMPLLLAACDTNATTSTGPTATPGGNAPAATAAEGTTPQPTQPSESVPPAGSGGTLRWANEGVNEIDTLDPPAAQSSNSVMAIGLIFDSLLRLDNRLNLQPAGAENWEISGDGKTYTFYIPKDLKWADGSP